MSDSSKLEMQGMIVEYQHALDREKTNLKNKTDEVAGLIEALPEHKDFAAASEAYDKAKEALELVISRNQEITAAKDSLTDLRQDVEDARDRLSSALLAYMVKHKVRSFEIDNQNHVIETRARIGKKLDNQMELPL